MERDNSTRLTVNRHEWYTSPSHSLNQEESTCAVGLSGLFSISWTTTCSRLLVGNVGTLASLLNRCRSKEAVLSGGRIVLHHTSFRSATTGDALCRLSTLSQIVCLSISVPFMRAVWAEVGPGMLVYFQARLLRSIPRPLERWHLI